MHIRLGTRGSALARWQAEWVSARLREQGVDVELVLIATSGDQQQGPIGLLGDRGLFTKEIQRALLDRRVDLAVHSLKDLPTDVVPGLALAAVPLRAPVCDALLSRDGQPFEELPQKAVIGTGSLRRRAQLRNRRADLELRDLRGNVDTRLRKLRDGNYDAIVLAQAGLERLGLAQHITQVLDVLMLLPAVGQGALGLETRSDDQETRRAVAALNHVDTFQAVTAERAMLTALCGGCLAPIGAWARIVDGRLVLSGRVLSGDGARRLDVTLDAEPAQATLLGQNVAERLIEQGAASLIAESRLPA